MSGGRRDADGVHDFVEGLVRIGREVLVKQLGLDAERAHGVMTEVATRVVAEYARTYLYVPVSYDLRDSEIWREYCEPGPAGADGRPGAAPFSHERIVELAEKHQRTVRQLYTIISTRRKLDRSARGFPSEQPLLDGLDAEQ